MTTEKLNKYALEKIFTQTSNMNQPLTYKLGSRSLYTFTQEYSLTESEGRVMSQIGPRGDKNCTGLEFYSDRDVISKYIYNLCSRNLPGSSR